jgi:hypothetical protein
VICERTVALNITNPYIKRTALSRRFFWCMVLGVFEHCSLLERAGSPSKLTMVQNHYSVEICERTVVLNIRNPYTQRTALSRRFVWHGVWMVFEHCSLLERAEGRFPRNVTRIGVPVEQVRLRVLRHPKRNTVSIWNVSARGHFDIYAQNWMRPRRQRGEQNGPNHFKKDPRSANRR